MYDKWTNFHNTNITWKLKHITCTHVFKNEWRLYLFYWDQLAVFDMSSQVKRRFKILDNDFKWLAQKETISDRCSYSNKKYILIYTTHIHITLNVANCGFCGESIFVLFLSSFYVLNFLVSLFFFFFVFGNCDTKMIYCNLV